MGVQRLPVEGRMRGVVPSGSESLETHTTTRYTCMEFYHSLTLTWFHNWFGLAVCVCVKIVLLWNDNWCESGMRVQ